MDCSARLTRGQCSILFPTHLVDFVAMAVPRRKTVQAKRWLGFSYSARCYVAALSVFIFSASAVGQFVDPLNAYPPRWSLDENDCEARVTEQGHASDAGAEGGRCETITIVAGHGTKAVLVYPIEPVHPIDALTAMVSVKGLSRGIRIGFRVRFPYLIDPQTKRPAALLVYGSSYEHVGEFQRLGVSEIDRDLKLKRVSLRNQFGASADVSSPYVDAVVINAYGGAGNHTLRIDDLIINAMVPLVSEQEGRSGESLLSRRSGDSESNYDVRRQTTANATESFTPTAAFPTGRITRILQHNGEPLAWVRSLGFDAVWLSQPPSATILSEAIAARMKIYAPAPSAPDEQLAPLLEPVAGWIVGESSAMDSVNEAMHAETAARLRRLPARWQRPLLGSPVESFRQYAAMLDNVVLDAPPRVRSLSSAATKHQRNQQITRVAGKPIVIGIAGMANYVATLQSAATAMRIGTPASETFAWHGMWRQIADALGDQPAAILIRSSASLTSGAPVQQSRGMALSFVNRFIATIEPWVSMATAQHEGEMVMDAASGLPIYFAQRLTAGTTTLLIMTTAMGRGDTAMAGDGKAIEIRLPPHDEGKMMWRLTHFSAERLTPETNTTGTSLQIVSPDVVEVIAISNDLSEAGKLAASAQRYARQAALDRWQLAAEAIRNSETTWNSAVAARVVSRSIPADLIQVANTSLNAAEQLVRSGQSESSLRMSRRADAWCAKSNWMLHDALLEGVHGSTGQVQTTAFISSPPLIAGDFETQAAWSPLLKTPVNSLSSFAPSVVNQMGTRSRWSMNRIAGDFESGLSGDSDSLSGNDVLARQGWSLGRRHARWAEAEATLIQRGAFSGRGALRLRVTPHGSDPLPGGYEGTCLMIRSPAVRMQQAAVVRIDLVVRTLGFNDPHQGLLIYDTVGTQELGVLVSDQPNWIPVTLFREIEPDTNLHVMMEVIGGGEAMIDDIQIRTWETVANPTASLRPMDSTLP
jgi:hypothetical protein